MGFTMPTNLNANLIKGGMCLCNADKQTRTLSSVRSWVHATIHGPVRVKTAEGVIFG
jgi:hypothetical protein